jgi:indolepyruvate ferredoxin oxidoreductase
MTAPTGDRAPWFCSGCPHNTSTRVPEGSRALAGIGCHYMSVWMDRSTSTFSQMGGEGVAWVGQSPFSKDQHVFANLGDGTYFHSGILAIRQSIAAGVNITYKVLYNDAVAMTGGQQVGERPEGHSVLQIMKSLVSEGVAGWSSSATSPLKYEAWRWSPASPCTTATNSTASSASCARSRAPRPSSTTRPAPPRSAAAASAASWPTRPSAW